jgi:hypothetical protein
LKFSRCRIWTICRVSQILEALKRNYEKPHMEFGLQEEKGESSRFPSAAFINLVEDKKD